MTIDWNKPIRVKQMPNRHLFATKLKNGDHYLVQIDNIRGDWAICGNSGTILFHSGSAMFIGAHVENVPEEKRDTIVLVKKRDDHSWMLLYSYPVTKTEAENAAKYYEGRYVLLIVDAYESPKEHTKEMWVGDKVDNVLDSYKIKG